jgi:serine/threonine-protein kinase
MPGPAPNSGDGVSLSAEHRVDAVCQRFEAAWKAGEEPRIAEFLTGWEEPDRSVLLQELLLIDRAYRHPTGETPSLAFHSHATPASTSRTTPTWTDWWR